VEAKLAGLLKGEYKPVDNKERLALAQACTAKQLYLTAAGLYANAFADDPKLADDLKSWHRYNAACCAALAAAKLDEKERVRWRKQALEWLQADLTLYRKLAATGKAADQAEVQAKMQHWQKDSDLAGIRAPGSLAKLPPEERQACEKLWADVEALLRQVRPRPAEKGPDAG
jgi:hypothetical protein